MKLANRANFDVPVAFFIFNRPLVTARVFSRIAQMRPSRLMIVADGPRSEVESQLCDAARACVADITWDCDVQWNYSNVNLGCRRRMSSGINWVFKQCDQAILLEDDCLPDPTFFQYCREMLARYEDEDRVMTIGGANFQFGVRRTPYSYYFSAVHHIWGWATWRRAWRHYDVEMKQWPNVAQTNFPDMLPDYAASFARRDGGDIRRQAGYVGLSVDVRLPDAAGDVHPAGGESDLQHRLWAGRDALQEAEYMRLATDGGD